jgi:hypothetical protein
MLADLFKTGEELIAAGLRRMQATGTLKPTASPDDLAVGLMAALQRRLPLGQHRARCPADEDLDRPGARAPQDGPGQLPGGRGISGAYVTPL